MFNRAMANSSVTALSIRATMIRMKSYEKPRAGAILCAMGVIRYTPAHVFGG